MSLKKCWEDGNNIKEEIVGDLLLPFCCPGSGQVYRYLGTARVLRTQANRRGDEQHFLTPLNFQASEKVLHLTTLCG